MSPSTKPNGQLDPREVVPGEQRSAFAVVRAAGVRDHEVDRALGGHEGDVRIDAALEPPRRLGGQLVPARGARDRDGVERRRLDQHVARRARHLGRSAAHDTREADGARLVGDEQVLDVQVADLAVERLQLLPRRRAAHGDAAGERVEVVAVQRLAEFEHHVVGDVDQDAERADSGEREAGDHPRRRGPRRVDVAHDAGDELRGADPTADGRHVRHDGRERVLRVRDLAPARARRDRGSPLRWRASTRGRRRGSTARSRGRG